MNHCFPHGEHGNRVAGKLFHRMVDLKPIGSFYIVHIIEYVSPRILTIDVRQPKEKWE